jgi:hypothetical protein
VGSVHIEDILTDPKAFLDLVAAINLFEIPAVVIPSAAHLGDPTAPESKWAYFERETTRPQSRRANVLRSHARVRPPFHLSAVERPAGRGGSMGVRNS